MRRLVTALAALCGTLCIFYMLAGCTAGDGAALPPSPAPRRTATPAATPAPTAAPDPTETAAYNTAVYNRVEGWNKLHIHDGGRMGVLVALDGHRSAVADLTGQIHHESDRLSGWDYLYNEWNPRHAPNGLMGYVDYTGAYVVPPVFDSALPFGGNGLAVVWRMHEGTFFIDRNGNRVGAVYEDIAVYENGFTVFTENGLCRLTDETGRVLIEGADSIYTVVPREPNLFYVYKSGLFGLYRAGGDAEAVDYAYTEIAYHRTMHLLYATQPDGGAALIDPATLAVNRQWDAADLQPYTYEWDGIFTESGEGKRLIPASDGYAAIAEYAPGSGLTALGRGHVLLGTPESAVIQTLDGQTLYTLPPHDEVTIWQSADARFAAFVCDGAHVLVMDMDTGLYTTAAGAHLEETDATIIVYGAGAVLFIEKDGLHAYQVSDKAADAVFVDGSDWYFSFMENGQTGLCDARGNVVLAPVFDDAWAVGHGVLGGAQGTARSFFFRKDADVTVYDAGMFAADVDFSIAVDIPEMHLLPGALGVYVHGALHEVSAVREWDEDVYVPLAELRPLGLPYMGIDINMVAVGGVMFGFAPGSDAVHVRVFDPNTRMFSAYEQKMDHQFQMGDPAYQWLYPVRALADLLGLHYERDADTGIVSIGGGTLRCNDSDSGFVTSPRTFEGTAVDRAKLENALIQAAVPLP